MKCGFRQGRGCLEKVFSVTHVCKKYLAKGKNISGRLSIWKRYMIRSMCMVCQDAKGIGVGRKLLKAVQSFHVDSKAFVRVGNGVSVWVPVPVGLR